MQLFINFSVAFLLLQGSVSANGEEDALRTLAEVYSELSHSRGLSVPRLPSSDSLSARARVREVLRSEQRQKIADGLEDPVVAAKLVSLLRKPSIALNIALAVEESPAVESALRIALKRDPELGREIAAALEREAEGNPAVTAARAAVLARATDNDIALAAAAPDRNPEVAGALKTALIQAQTPVEERFKNARVEILVALAKANVYGPDGGVYTSMQKIPREILYEAANQNSEVKRALLEFHVLRYDAARARAGLPALTPAEVRLSIAKVELLLALAKAKVYGPDGAVFLSMQQLTEEVVLEAANQHPDVAEAYQAVKAAKAQVEQEAARLALEKQGIPIFTIATPTDKEDAKVIKHAIAAEGNPHEIQANDAKCVICLEEYKDGASIGWLKCKHHADIVCLARWLSANPTCPMCRKMA